jgi:hypothetical protein
VLLTASYGSCNSLPKPLFDVPQGYSWWWLPLTCLPSSHVMFFDIRFGFSFCILQIWISKIDR